MRFLHDLVRSLVALLIGSQKAIRDVIILMLPQAVSLVTGFVSSILLARGLGPPGLGKYALVLSLAGIAGSLSDLGIGQTAIRYASRAAAAGDTPGQMSMLRWAFRIRMGLVLLITLVFFLGSRWLAVNVWHSSDDLASLLQLGLIGGIFTALASIPSIYFQSLQRFGKSAEVLVGQALISLAGIIGIALANSWSVRNVVLVSLAASAIGAVAFLLRVPREALLPRIGIMESLRQARRRFWTPPAQAYPVPENLHETGPASFVTYNLISTILVLIILRADVWLMGAYLSNHDVGVYNVASRFALPLAILLAAINSALWPRASKRMGEQELLSMLTTTFKLSASVAALSTVYAMIFPLLAPWLFGSDFAESTPLAQLLSLRYAFAIFISPIGVIGYSLGMVRIYWIVNLIQLGAVVAINILFLQRIGPTASALALIANEILSVLIVGGLVWQKVSELREHQAV